MSETGRRSSARFKKRNQFVTAKKRPRQVINTPFGHKLTVDLFLEPLADFFAGKCADQPDKPPRFLRKLVRELDDPRFLALAALAPLLDGIFRGFDRDDPSAAAKLKLKIGDDLYQRLRQETEVKPRWDAAKRVQAGHWLLWQALRLDFFGYDEDGFPRISDKWLPEVEQLREAMIAADPAYAPHLKPPPPWTGSSKTYDDGYRAKFVRDWRPETKAAIEAAFVDPDWDHAGGVNALSQVPLKIDPGMVALVERFAVELMGNDDAKIAELSAGAAAADADDDARRRAARALAKSAADKVTVAIDVEDAKWCGERVIWNDYSCDRRGRIYALQHLNFARADHVRSLLRFANGMKLAGEPNTKTKWLEIHCANCEGSTDKKSRDERRKWASEHRQDIQDIASDPIGTFDSRVLDGRGWKSADSPFCFVAACRELAAAWKDPENFETHLPIGFDGSANGLQHLSLLIGDFKSGSMVNLLSNDHSPRDVYATLIARALELIEADDCDHARWWRKCFDERLSQKEQRKLLKQPIMTFAYSVTPRGATRKIAKVYYGSLHQKVEPADGAFGYLARKVLEACALELSGPKRVMDYICAVADHCTDQGRFLEWTSPSGFPVSNRYQVPNIVTVNCMRGSVRVAEHEIADGVTDQIDHSKVLSAAAPNFVHSLDAAHLIKVVNAAVSEGISDLLTVHDCFYCLAPQATRLHKIILAELADLYRDNEPLAELHSQNVSDPDILPVPPKGVLMGWEDGTTWRAAPFSLEFVKEAENAFG